jgi:hypothetical protein
MNRFRDGLAIVRQVNAWSIVDEGLSVCSLPLVSDDFDFSSVAMVSEDRATPIDALEEGTSDRPSHVDIGEVINKPFRVASNNMSVVFTPFQFQPQMLVNVEAYPTFLPIFRVKFQSLPFASFRRVLFETGTLHQCHDSLLLLGLSVKLTIRLLSTRNEG